MTGTETERVRREKRGEKGREERTKRERESTGKRRKPHGSTSKKFLRMEMMK